MNNQQFTSAKTYINSKKLPAIVSKVEKFKGFIKDVINLDLGGGRFDIVTDYLKSQYIITNLILDPYNRTAEHNTYIENIINRTKVDNVTISNVLNVINSIDCQIKVPCCISQ